MGPVFAVAFYMREELRSDGALRSYRDFVLMAVAQHGHTLEHVSEDLQSDREVAMAAVRQEGYALQFTAEKCRSDREVVLEAVTEDGLALQFAAGSLRADPEVVLQAVSQNEEALQYASLELRSDRNFVLQAARCNWHSLAYASADFEEDPEIVDAVLSWLPIGNDVPAFLRLLGWEGLFVLQVGFLSGTSMRMVIHPKKSAREVTAGALGLLAERAQMDYILPETNYACAMGEHRIPDDMRVRQWPGVQPVVINDVTLIAQTPA